jgi:hypothetical protein
LASLPGFLGKILKKNRQWYFFKGFFSNFKVRYKAQ